MSTAAVPSPPIMLQGQHQFQPFQLGSQLITPQEPRVSIRKRDGKQGFYPCAIQALLSSHSLGVCSTNAMLTGPRQANLVLIVYAYSEGSGEPAHPRSLARTFAARSYKQWIKRNLQTETQIPGPSEWLDMRSWNLSWRNARRHKFAWRGSTDVSELIIVPNKKIRLWFKT